MIEILWRIMNIADRVRNMSVVSTAAMGIFGVLLVFGVINCILGYRLLRFWMMLFGFVIGAGIGLGVAYSSGTQEQYVYIGAALAVGVILAILAFLIYKVGIFILGAGLGLALSIYVLHPTTSFVFFVFIGWCGSGHRGYASGEGVIIVGTSLLGGILAGFSLAKLGNMEEIPYGIAMSAGFAVLGILIQFATNKPRIEEEEEEEDRPKKRRRKGSQAKRAGGYSSDGYAAEDYFEDYGVDEYEIEEELEKEEAYERLEGRTAETNQKRHRGKGGENRPGMTGR